MNNFTYIAIGVALGLVTAFILVYQVRHKSKDDIFPRIMGGALLTILSAICWPVLIPSLYFVAGLIFSANKLAESISKKD